MGAEPSLTATAVSQSTFCAFWGVRVQLVGLNLDFFFFLQFSRIPTVQSVYVR